MVASWHIGYIWATTAIQYRIRDGLVTEEERQVSEILLDLPKLLQPFRSLSAIGWGKKRTRSSFPTSVSTPCGSETAFLKPETASPATPLSFSPSDVVEEHSRPKVSRRRDFRKKSHKELKVELARLCAERIQLEQEYTNRREYWIELKALNLRLISRFKEKQNQFSLRAFYQPEDLRQCRSLDPIANINPTAVAAFLGNPCVDIKNHLLLRTSAENATRGVPCREGHEGQQQPSLALIMPSGRAGMALEKNQSMTVAFDFMHIPVPFKKNRASIAAEARKKRMEINREKNSVAFKQSRPR